ncbi:MAG: stage II sporulation protein M [Gemmatimonadota bacterium]
MITQPVDFRQQLDIETPEHVIVQIEIAGLGSRALAAILDILILLVWTYAFQQVSDAVVGSAPGGWITAILILVNFAVYWGYFTGFEAWRGGQTPGKQLVGIRVIRDTGHGVTFSSAAVRNLLRIADFLPPPYLTGLALILFHPRAKRLGDMVAGTVVIRDRPAPAGAAAEVSTTPSSVSDDLGAPELDDAEFRLLREFIERSATLDEASRDRLATRLAGRFAERYPVRPLRDLMFLRQLYRLELDRRQGRFVISRPGGAGLAERFVAQKQARWKEFHTLATRVTGKGLDSLGADELPDFAARYRELAADLARARTYGASTSVLFQLERLVSSGHNALYRDPRPTLRRLGHILLRECPAAIITARRYVLAAFLAFAVPAAGGFLLLRQQPAQAAELLPDVMLLRAEQARAEIAHGRGYAETESERRPAMASFIIKNNILVSFICFATGVFVGVGSLLSLGFNGLLFGTVLGHFQNVGVLEYILRFVMGHGFLELFAIWVAGGAGLLLGLSFIIPGRATRAEALVQRGRIAVRMIGAVILMLLIAGTIEGFVSAGEGSFQLRLFVSSASVVFLVAYLLNGALYLGKNAAPPAAAAPATPTRAS